MKKTILLLAALGMALPGTTRARPYIPLSLPGHAEIGAASQQVQFVFACSQNDGPQLTGGLSVAILVPNFERLRPVFDFDVFEGPTGDTGRRTHLETNTDVKGDFAAGGYITALTGAPFALGVGAMMRNDAKRLTALRNILRPLTSGAGILRWTQGNPNPGSAVIHAEVAVSAADAAHLRATLGPCLAISG